ncbi:hypothetical protein [Vibrio fortis]|nr:hypothetical protein [Vibrio fortis]
MVRKERLELSHLAAPEPKSAPPPPPPPPHLFLFRDLFVSKEE